LLVLRIILSIESGLAGFHFDRSVDLLSASIVSGYYLQLIADGFLYFCYSLCLALTNHRNFLGAVSWNNIFLCLKVAHKRGNLSLVSFHSALLVLLDWRLFLAFFLFLHVIRTVFIS